MQKTIIGVLVILLIALLAINGRLQERERVLEERLAAAERKRTPKTAPAPAPEPAAAVVDAPRPVTAPPAAVVKVEMPKPAEAGSSAATERFLRKNLDAVQLQLAWNEAQPDKSVLTLLATEPPLPEGRQPGYLGISGGDAKGGGAQVTDVFPNGVAGAAGLKSGDVIVEFNGESVQGLADLARRVRETGEGAPVSLRIRRDGSEFVQGVQLGRRPQ